jgi:hypothetical protein
MKLGPMGNVSHNTNTCGNSGERKDEVRGLRRQTGHGICAHGSVYLTQNLSPLGNYILDKGRPRQKAKKAYKRRKSKK